MRHETRRGVTVDRCDKCDALWFDAAELDRWLQHVDAESDRPPESRIPARGVGSRLCPRCHVALGTAGWDGLVLDRCARCRGLFVEAGEATRIQRDGLPEEEAAFESRLTEAMVRTGWTLLAAAEIAMLVMRFLRR